MAMGPRRERQASLVAGNVLWIRKAAVERQLEEARRKSNEATSQLKIIKDMLTSSQTQQEAEHMQVQALTSKIKELEERQASAVAAAGAVRLPALPKAPTAAPAEAARAPPAAANAPADALQPRANPQPAAAGALAAPDAGGGGHSEVVPVIVFACCRVRYLERTLNTLFERMPKASTTSFEVWVSQDGEDRAVKDMVKSKFPQVHYIQHIDRSPLGKASPGESDNYYKIARHYGWGFQQVFADARYTWAIVLEDDLEVAPDFFNYMIAGAALLRKDASLWTVTAWNDNGLQQFAHDASKLYRSDFFGGLGWIMTRTLWNELGPKWPKGYWDDWMREPPQRRGRSCIRPEVSRTTTFGKEGSSNGQVC